MPSSIGSGPRNLVWLDFEFTTIELPHAAIMQAALIVTDAELRPIPPPADLVPGNPHGLCFDLALTPEQAATASDWVRENQAEQLRRCVDGPGTWPLRTVERLFAAYVTAACTLDAGEAPPRTGNAADDKPVLAGNSVHNDYFLVQAHLPALAALLSYRLVDVSTLKELVRRWAPELLFDKTTMVQANLPDGLRGDGEKHDALHDVECSIAELAYYRRVLLKR